MKPIIKATLIAAGLVFLLSITGCARMFASRTSATYETPDGKKISYESDKEQIGLDAVYELYENGQVKAVRIKVDKAGTQESVVAAALQTQQMMGELLKTLVPMIQKAGGAFATMP